MFICETRGNMKYTIYTRDGETIKTKDPKIGTVFVDCQPECMHNHRYLIPVINISRITYEVKEDK